jgi:hypothetical protein
MEFKYIMLLDRRLDRRVPIIFFEPITHIGVYKMTRESYELKALDLVSAGFGRVSGVKLFALVEVFGESASLKMENLPCHPLKDDGRVISTYNYSHGF